MEYVELTNIKIGGVRLNMNITHLKDLSVF